MTDPALTIEQVNRMDGETFVAAFGHVYEATPALASAAHSHRPFADRAALVAAFGAVADQLGEPDILLLLRAHPQLGARGSMTAESTHEQRSAGLAAATVDADATRQEIESGNARYLERFGFPFIIAVRGLGPADVAAALAERLDHDEEEERATALAQVKRIAALRIEQVVAE